MPAESLADWLRCPNCGQPLEAVSARELGCVTGHRFDLNKRGYITLLSSRSNVVGDSVAMLDARDRVLDRGTYSPIADALVRAVGDRDGGAPVHIVDAGTGTGYYLSSLLASSHAARGLAMDLSPAAVARAVRRSERIDGLVADTWRPLPIRSGVADVVVNVFAPRNLTEFHRILKVDGRLVVVVPRADHLRQLRAAGGMLDVPADKAETVIAGSGRLFRLTDRTQVVYDLELELDDDLRRSLVEMGPSAHHRTKPVVGDQPMLSVTVDVDVLTLAANAIEV